MGLHPSSFSLLVLFVLVGFLNDKCILYGYADPTDGFTAVPLTDANFKIQVKYHMTCHLTNVTVIKMEYQSYGSTTTNDKPLRPDSMTKPRSEIRITGYEYSSGVWQFEGYGFVPNGTSGVSIVQIHGAAMGATTLQLRIYNGDLRYYTTDVVATDLYNKWFRVNVIQDVGAGKLLVFIDGVKKYERSYHGPGDLYFKCGVYAQNNASHYMESRWRDIKVYKKC